MAQELSQKLQQSLQITPEMRRSLEILQAPSVELRSIIASELSQNPALEFPDANESLSIEDLSAGGKKGNAATQTEEGETSQALNNASEAEISAEIFEKKSEILDYAPSSKNSSSPEDAERVRSFLFDSAESKENSLDKLISEAHINAENPESAEAFEFFVGELDERGFLPKESVEKAREKNFSDDAINEALYLLKNSEPFGLGAFDMKECLMIQLDKLGMKNTLAYEILENNFDLLMAHQIGKIAKIYGKQEGEISNSIEILKELNTSPARDLHEDSPTYIYADLKFLKNENGETEVELTGDYFPKLRINSDYRKIAALGGVEMSDGIHKLKDEEISLIKKQIRDAKSLIGMLEQRQQTLLKIGISILKRQPSFMDLGKTSLAPMTMQNVADDLGLHASTIGRAISEKYVDTPFGIIPLKFFFSGGISSNKKSDSSEISSAAAKEKIRRIIENEDRHKPYSDAQIAEILKKESLEIARRTIAKYREEMGFLPKSARKIY